MTDDGAVSTEIQIDDDTRAALLLFNERVEASATQERNAKRIAKAERQKDEAAAVVRKMNDNSNSSAQDKAEAEAAYKAAVENFQIIQANPDAGQPKPKQEAAPTEEAAPAEAPAEEAEAPAEETASAEEAAAPVEEAAAPVEEAAAPAEEAAAPVEEAPAEVSADEEPVPAAASSGESE